MRDLTLSVEKIVGLPTKNVGCGVFTKRVNLADGTLGSVTSCILVKSQAGLNVKDVLQDIFELATSKLESSGEGGLEALARSDSAIKAYLEGKDIEVSLAGAFFHEDACYITRLGEAVKVLIFDPPKMAQIKFEIGSGPVVSGQIYLLATEKLLSIFDTKILMKAEKKIDFGETIDGLATRISDEADQSEMGAAFIATRIAQEQESENEVPEGADATNQDEIAKRKGEDRVEEKRDYERPTESVSREPFWFLKAITNSFSKIRPAAMVKDKKRLRLVIVLVAILIVVALSVSAGVNIAKKKEKEKTLEFNSYLTNASEKYTEGVALVELNKSRAREVLIEADRQIKKALEIKSSHERAKQLEGDIATWLGDTEQTSDVNFEPLVSLESSAIALSWSGKDLVVVGDSKIFAIKTESGDTEEFEGVAGAWRAFTFDNKTFVLGDNKVIRVDLASEEMKEITQASGAHDIAVFLGNVYLLFDHKIDKYVPVEAGYLGPNDYLSAPADFGGKSHFAIDGAIWVTAKNKIYNFIRGEDQNFEFSGLTFGVGDLTLIYTNASLDNLYVVDSTNSALLVIGKDGVYKRAYQSREFGRATAVVVDEGEANMYISVADKILVAPL